MAKNKKPHGFWGAIKDGLIGAAMPINRHVEKAVKGFEDRVIRLEERVMRKMFSLIAIGIGAIFVAFALLFYLKELGWSDSAAYFSIGVIMFAVGLLLELLNQSKSAF